jgi:hypothetical protein
LSSARRSYELALGNVSDKVPELGGAMANKRTPKKRATKKRASKAPGKKAVTKATKKRASKAPAKKRTTRAPAKSSRPTKPAKPRAKRAAAAAAAAAVPASVPVPVPVPASVSAPAFGSAPPPEAGASSRPASYLEGVPHDHAELVSGLFQVVRGAAKDLKTLVTQAIAISSQKNDPFG